MSYVESNYNIKAIKQCAYICSNSGSQMHIFNKLSRRRIQCKTQRATCNSGVQRVLDARANEFLGCPQVTNYFPIPIHLPKFMTTFFTHFSQFLPSILNFCLDYLHFFHKTPSLDAPAWMPEAVVPLGTSS